MPEYRFALVSVILFAQEPKMVTRTSCFPPVGKGRGGGMNVVRLCVRKDIDLMIRIQFFFGSVLTLTFPDKNMCLMSSDNIVVRLF